MKMTMHIDENVLDEVMKAYEFESKTDAVNKALSEMLRLHKLRLYKDLDDGMTAEDWKNAVDPNYDVMADRVADVEAQLSQKNTLNDGDTSDPS